MEWIPAQRRGRTEFFHRGEKPMTNPEPALHDLEWARQQERLAPLQEECQKRGIPLPSRATKADLVRLIERDETLRNAAQAATPAAPTATGTPVAVVDPGTAHQPADQEAPPDGWHYKERRDRLGRKHKVLEPNQPATAAPVAVATTAPKGGDNLFSRLAAIAASVIMVVVVLLLLDYLGWLPSNNGDNYSTPTDSGTAVPTAVHTAVATIPPTSAPSATTPTGSTKLTADPKDFPKTASDAAKMFGGDAARWEPTADPGGWHLREEPFTTHIDPHGFLSEGYNDTKPGKNADCYVFADPINVQGATIWAEPGNKDNATKLQAKMAIPVWDDGQQHACRVLVN